MAAAGVALGAHIVARFVPHTLHVFNLMQSSVAILALASLAVLVVTHHRSNGQFLTQTQEEMILIGSFGLFWFAVLIAIRAFRQMGAVDVGGVATNTDVSSAMQTGGRNRGEAGFTAGRRRPYPCDPNSAYCVVEEWSWY